MGLCAVANRQKGAGVIVTSLEQGSLCEACGLQIGDIIFAVNGMPVNDDREAFREVESKCGMACGMIEYTLWGAEPSRHILIGKAGPAGVTIADHGLGPGVEVTDVVAADEAAAAGLPFGSIILSINRQPVDNHSTAIRLIEVASPVLEVRRHRAPCAAPVAGSPERSAWRSTHSHCAPPSSLEAPCHTVRCRATLHRCVRMYRSTSQPSNRTVLSLAGRVLAPTATACERTRS